MKKVFFASSALVLTAGLAYAEVTISGDGRMGILDSYDGKDFAGNSSETDMAFTSRVRITFKASGETDTGLSLGGSIRADNATDGAAGKAGSVYVEGPFGKLAMGDVDGGAKKSVGHAEGVGLTGLGDWNEIYYIANAGTDPSFLFTSATLSGFSGAFSVDDPGAESKSYSVGTSYRFNDMFGVSVGYERSKMLSISNVAGTELTLATNAKGDQIILGADAKFGPVEVKGVASDGEYGDGIDVTQFAGSLVLTAADQLDATAFFRNSEQKGASVNNSQIRAMGAGITYALDGSLSIKAGITNLDIESDSGANNGDSNSFDLGLSFAF